MRSKNVGYRSLDDLHGERERIAWYWEVLARISSWMLLSGYEGTKQMAIEKTLRLTGLQLSSPPDYVR
jgi:hypothetical protein